MGSSPRGHKESDTAERLSTAHRKGTALEVGKIKGSILSYYRDMTLEMDWEEERESVDQKYGIGHWSGGDER